MVFILAATDDQTLNREDIEYTVLGILKCFTVCSYEVYFLHFRLVWIFLKFTLVR